MQVRVLSSDPFQRNFYTIFKRNWLCHDDVIRKTKIDFWSWKKNFLMSCLFDLFGREQRSASILCWIIEKPYTIDFKKLNSIESEHARILLFCTEEP